MPEPLSPNSDNSSKIVTPKTVGDINDIFNRLDDDADKRESEKKTSEKDKEEDKGNKESKGDEDSEDDESIELKTDEEDEEKLDLSKSDEEEIEINAPPRKRDLLRDYPDLFKKHPFLEKMLYRDKEYSELFGSFDDAKEIAEKSEIFNNFETQLLSGKTDDILKSVKENDVKAFNKIVDDYLPALARVDKDAYYEVVGNMGKQLIMEMVREANSSNNDELKSAALAINQFLFGTSTYSPPQKRVNEKVDSEKNEIEQERLNHLQERFEESRDDLQTKVDNILRSTINEYIDPRGTMTSYVKKNAIKDALDSLHSSLGSDSSIKRSLDKLWRAAVESKFSKESLGRIQSFYLSKAKNSLPTAIKKARTEALKETAPVSREKQEDDSDEVTTPRRGHAPAGRPSQQNKKDGIKQGESVTDFFMRD